MHAVIAVNHEKFNCRLKNLKRILNLEEVFHVTTYTVTDIYLCCLVISFKDIICHVFSYEFHVWNLGSSLRLFAFVCQAPAQKMLFLVTKQLCLRSMFAIWQQGAPVSN